jgi:hypothetical protein
MRTKLIVVALVFLVASSTAGVLWDNALQTVRQAITPVGQLELEKLGNLYKAKSFKDVVAEAEQIRQNPQYTSVSAKLLYLEWAADRQIGDVLNGKRLEQQFLKSYPKDDWGADMYWANALDALALADYSEADSNFGIIERDYATTPLARQVLQIQNNLIDAEHLATTRQGYSG